MRPQLSQVITSSPRRISAITCGRSDMKHARTRTIARFGNCHTIANARADSRVKRAHRLRQTRKQLFALFARGGETFADRSVSSSNAFSLASRSEFRVAISSARSFSAASACSSSPSVRGSVFPGPRSVCGRRQLREWRRCIRPAFSTTSGFVRRVRPGFFVR